MGIFPKNNGDSPILKERSYSRRDKRWESLNTPFYVGSGGLRRLWPYAKLIPSPLSIPIKTSGEQRKHNPMMATNILTKSMVVWGWATSVPNSLSFQGFHLLWQSLETLYLWSFIEPRPYPLLCVLTRSRTNTWAVILQEWSQSVKSCSYNRLGILLSNPD